MAGNSPCANCGTEKGTAIDAMNGLCMVCALASKPENERVSVPTNPNNWSKETRQMTDRYGEPTHYFDEYYWCECCAAMAVFTAEEQRVAYEERKAYLCQRRTLCSTCHEHRTRIVSELKDIRALWRSDRSRLQADTQFLDRWLRLLHDHVKHGGAADESHMEMLGRLLTGG